MPAELCRRFAWLTTTPFGADVEPEVYWRKATESPSTAGARHSAERWPGRSSVESHRSAESSGATSKSTPAIDPISAVVSTTVACASATMAWRRGTVRARRMGSGGYAGTAIAPASKQPKKASTKAKPGG